MLLIASSALAVSACGDDGSSADDTSVEGDAVDTDDESADTAGDHSTSRPPPTVPPSDDPAYAISVPSSWLLVGDGLTPEDTEWVALVTAAPGVARIEAWLDGVGPVAFDGTSGAFEVLIDETGLPVGDHQVIMAAAGSDVAFAARTFNRSHALYVIMATDWDDSDNSQAYLDNMDTLRSWHPGLRYSHYFGPYTLTDPAVSMARRGELVSWLTTRRDTYGDEIGVHLHPYCTFVDTTAVTCRTEPSDVYAAGDATGYTVIVASYTTEEMTTLLSEAANLFESAGLGRPTSFRAGGWTADAGTLAAVEAAGYLVDANAIVPDRIEEWQGVMNGVFYEWLMEHWWAITVTSQPYRPSATDVSVPAASPETGFGVLEVPANAVIADYVTGGELIDIFAQNWPLGAPLPAPTIWHTGLHPPNFAVAMLTKLDQGLDNADLYLHSSGTGPVVYATATELREVDAYGF